MREDAHAFHLTPSPLNESQADPDTLPYDTGFASGSIALVLASYLRVTLTIVILLIVVLLFVGTGLAATLIFYFQ